MHRLEPKRPCRAEAQRENEVLTELLREVRETKATFRYKNKIIMEPR